ncbi:hypothetical protein L1857_26245 [Amycolatopsis thermalba]|uniref:Uncharacterized protein n=1 Tax=Amycolatopsis thermalba TaxID=944492 RepID=A0ABY4P157_9PSEU|nr:MULTISPECIES: hypothetical protein [Amycolatopsis]UQS26064.1 hypothetical protein L1857_26245 [Amycolatopsis thermalba]
MASNQTPDEALAFRRLQGFARKVAADLRRAGVPRDSVVVREAQQVKRPTPGGLFRRAKAEVVEAPDRQQVIDGWRVFSEDQEEQLLQDTAGSIRSTRYTKRSFEVWLLGSGRLVAVDLRHETVSNNVRGSAPTSYRSR